MSVRPRFIAAALLIASCCPAAYAQVQCVSGFAGGYPCNNTTLLAVMTPMELGASNSGIQVNDSWGWTDPDSGKEYALVGRRDGTAFVDISDPVNPVLMANLPTNSSASIWRDIKVYANHAFVVADGAGQHGMQVFDLKRLRSIGSPPETVAADFIYTEIGSAHNIVINEETGFAYLVGTNSGGVSCAGGLHMIDISNPLSPTFVGCQTDASVGRGYTHDAQCVVYHGPDVEHVGKEICFNSNESGVNIADVSNKSAPTTLSFPTYPAARYVHQGWLSEDHRYFYQGDELDELQGSTNTTTYIWDVADLDDPILAVQFDQGTRHIDHNLYIRGDLLYEANYTAGLQVFDISDRENPVLAAHFDTWPDDNATGFNGAWSNYPFFASRTVVISSSNGLFLVGTQIPAAVDSPLVAHEDPVSVDVYPNPFVGRSTVRVHTSTTQAVRVKVIDILGRDVAILYEGPIREGDFVELGLDDDSLPSGQYIVHISTENGTVSRNIVKMR